MPEDIFILLKKDIKNEFNNFISSIPYNIKDTENKTRYYICGNKGSFEIFKNKIDNNIQPDSATLCSIALDTENNHITIIQSEGYGEAIKHMYKIVKWIYDNYKDQIINIEICSEYTPPTDYTDFFHTKGVDEFYHPEKWENVNK